MYRARRAAVKALSFGVKIASWNVNGIRARAAQLCEWLQRDRPDVVCLQELKATAAQIPAECKVPDYHAYWHTLKGYSGVSLHVRKDLFAVDPVFSHPPFDMESRIVQVEHGDLVIASIYVPNGDRKSTRLNSSHLVISYAVFCLKKKKKKHNEAVCTRACYGTPKNSYDCI